MEVNRVRTHAEETHWALFTAVVVSRAYRAALITLAIIATVPVLIGMQSFLIHSGSMQPSISVGDVALGRDYEEGEEVAVGRVYMFQDPEVSESHLLVHRVVERRNEGDFLTQGDANRTPDTTPITADHLQARAILLVPYVGLPVVWASQGAFGKLGLWLLLTMLAFFLASRNIDGEPPRWTLRRLLRERLSRRRTPASATEADEPRESVLTRTGKAVACTLAVCLIGGTASTATATFTATTRTAGSTWTAGQWLLPYVQAVMADKPSGFWLLDEPGGRVVNDRSGTYANGTTIGAVTPGQAGALTARNPGTSYDFDGGRAILNPDRIGAPGAYTVELWMRTSSRQQQYLAGFDSGTGAASLSYDRSVTMDGNGRIVVGDWTTPWHQQREITTPASYNDGRWHHVVVTATPALLSQHSVIYVDGTQVASGTTTGGGGFAGHWRIGGGTVPGSWNLPVSRSFDGQLDAVAIYPRVLVGTQVRAHYDAR